MKLYRRMEFDHEHRVVGDQPAHGSDFRCEEIRGEERVPVGAQERAPRHRSFTARWNALFLEDRCDRRRSPRPRRCVRPLARDQLAIAITVCSDAARGCSRSRRRGPVTTERSKCSARPNRMRYSAFSRRCRYRRREQRTSSLTRSFNRDQGRRRQLSNRLLRPLFEARGRASGWKGWRSSKPLPLRRIVRVICSNSMICGLEPQQAEDLSGQVEAS